METNSFSEHDSPESDDVSAIFVPLEYMGMWPVCGIPFPLLQIVHLYNIIRMQETNVDAYHINFTDHQQGVRATEKTTLNCHNKHCLLCGKTRKCDQIHPGMHTYMQAL